VQKTKSHAKLVSLILLVVAGIASATIYSGYASQPKTPKEIKIDGLYLPKPTDINDFKLQDNLGKTFTKENLKGHWTFMFFGFTNCGMVCPTTMAALKQMKGTLQTDLPANEMPQIVMVSVDPDRDTVERMNEYVTSFDPTFIGTRAEMPQISALEKELHLVSVKIQADGQNKNQYSINHSAEILIFNPDAKLQAFLSYPHVAEQMTKDYKLILNNKG
jgi:protein SCO1/2